MAKISWLTHSFGEDADTIGKASAPVPCVQFSKNADVSGLSPAPF